MSSHFAPCLGSSSNANRRRAVSSVFSKSMFDPVQGCVHWLPCNSGSHCGVHVYRVQIRESKATVGLQWLTPLSVARPALPCHPMSSLLMACVICIIDIHYLFSHVFFLTGLEEGPDPQCPVMFLSQHVTKCCPTLLVRATNAQLKDRPLPCRAHAHPCKGNTIAATCRHAGPGGLSHRWTKVLPISYALYSGMLGTQSVLFSKTLSTLLRTTLDGNSQLGSWFTWIILMLFIATAVFWVTRLNLVGHLAVTAVCRPAIML